MLPGRALLAYWTERTTCGGRNYKKLASNLGNKNYVHIKKMIVAGKKKRRRREQITKILASWSQT